MNNKIVYNKDMKKKTIILLILAALPITPVVLFLLMFFGFTHE